MNYANSQGLDPHSLYASISPLPFALFSFPFYDALPAPADPELTNV